MSKKKKQAVKKPPLSKRDKWIYNLMIVIGFVLILLLWLLFLIRIPRAIGFSKQGVIACGDQSGVFTSLPFAACIGFSVALLASKGKEGKQPIFENKNIKDSSVYPIISKEFWQRMTVKTKKKMKVWGITFAVLFVVCSVILLIGLFPRSVLYEDGRIESYGIINQLKASEHMDTADFITLEIERTTTRSGRYGIRRNTHYFFYFRFVFEEETYSFSIGDFGEMNRTETLLYMKDLKERFGERYTLIGTQYVDDMVDSDWETEEKELFYDLFDLQ